MADPFGRAILDHARDERTAPLYQVDGDERLEHPVERFYFEARDPDDEWTEWFEARLTGPHLDMGAGAGRDALYWQEHFETVAIEVSDHLVTVMDERGVADARHADMFDLRATFDRDRFRSAQAFGTQAALAHSQGRLRSFLGDLAHVTTPDGVAVLDAYDPDAVDTDDLLGYRSVPEAGVAYRTFHFEYEGDVGETLLFRLFSPARLREACHGTPWVVDEVAYANDHHYNAVLRRPES